MSKKWKGIIGQRFSAESFAAYCETVELKWTPKGITLHNTDKPSLADWKRVGGEVRIPNLEHYYRNQQKWSAGPHLFIEPKGIWVFSPLSTPGVHSPSFNSTHYGVEVVGNYRTETFTSEHQAIVVAAIASLCELADLEPSTLNLHKHDPRTTHDCPSTNLAVKYQEIIREVGELLKARQAVAVAVVVDGKPVAASAYITKGLSYVAIRPVASALGWVVHQVSEGQAHMGKGTEVAALPLTLRDGAGYVTATDLERLNVSVNWDHPTKTLKVVSR